MVYNLIKEIIYKIKICKQKYTNKNIKEHDLNFYNKQR